MINVLIPMAGRGSRFEQAGYSLPKPLVDVQGHPMISRVIENLGIEARYIFLCLKEHVERYQLDQHLPKFCGTNPCQIVVVDQVTEGAACTALLAQEFLENDNELLIANSDQVVEWKSDEFLYHLRAQEADGGILTFPASGPKWSYVRLNEVGEVIEVAEKREISSIGTVGIYYFKKGRFFVEAAQQMIQKNIRTNQEFYIAPVFNEMIENHQKILPFQIEKMHGLGTPEDLERYLKTHEL